MKILFMCVANSARSQLAEGLARQILGEKAKVQSAGSHPGSLNPYAVQVMKEIGIDIGSHFAKAFTDLPVEFISQLDYVITLCSEEVCPVVPGNAKRLHWPFPDPAVQVGSELDQLRCFREVRDAIRVKLEHFRPEL